MLGNGHVPFLGGGMMVTSSCYPTVASSGGIGTSPSSYWFLPTLQHCVQPPVAPLLLPPPASLLLLDIPSDP